MRVSGIQKKRFPQIQNKIFSKLLFSRQNSYEEMWRADVDNACSDTFAEYWKILLLLEFFGFENKELHC